MSTCGKCNQKVYFMEQIAYKGGFWHKNCFKCATCKKQMEPGGFLDHDNVPYCTSCFNKQFKPKGYGFGSNNLHSFEQKKGDHSAGQAPGPNASAARAGSPDLGAKGLTKPAVGATKPASPAASSAKPSPAKSTSTPAAKSAAAKTATPAAEGKPEVNKLDKDRWYIENFDAKKSKRTDPIVVEVTEVKQSVFIGKCTGVVIQIKGKCKQVTISGCQECGIQTDTVVSTIEVINSKKCQVQPTDKVGLVQLDGSERTSVYLSQSMIDDETKMFTAKSNATLIYTPLPDGDLKEIALPEQFISHVADYPNSKALTNEIVVPEALLS